MLTKWFCFEINQHCSCKCEGNNQWWRCEVIGSSHWMNTTFKVSVSRQNTHSYKVTLQHNTQPQDHSSRQYPQPQDSPIIEYLKPQDPPQQNPHSPQDNFSMQVLSKCTRMFAMNINLDRFRVATLKNYVKLVNGWRYFNKSLLSSSNKQYGRLALSMASVTESLRGPLLPIHVMQP